MATFYKADVAIIGAGLAGLTTALELLDSDKSILLIDSASEEKLGGLANNAFGGMLLNATREQKLLGVKDSPELMLSDWLRAAEFGPEHQLQKQWAEAYAYRSTDEVYQWLRQQGVSFFPIVNWVERGDFQPGNSVPRYHVAWGCGRSVVQTLLNNIRKHKNASRIRYLFNHRVQAIDTLRDSVECCRGQNCETSFVVEADHFVLATGGINGNLERVRKVWDPVYGEPPQELLNGGDPYTDGHLHDVVTSIGGRVEHLNWMWNYAAGISHPQPRFDHEGLALIPPRSSLWMDCYGRRVGPDPMIGAFDTHRLCKRMGNLDHQYGWLVLNWPIAIREMAISGSDMNPNFRDKKLHKVLLGLITGSRSLVRWMIDECPDVVIGNSIPELAAAMDRLVGEARINVSGMAEDIERYDHLIRSRKMYHADDQIRRIGQARRWIGDYVRTANFRPIIDAKSLPLIAIRTRLLSRKSMGGMVTDLSSRVLQTGGGAFQNLYAAGEAAGFGGGGICGKRSLEGTFLSNCIFNGRIAASSITR